MKKKEGENERGGGAGEGGGTVRKTSQKNLRLLALWPSRICRTKDSSPGEFIIRARPILREEFSAGPR